MKTRKSRVLKTLLLLTMMCVALVAFSACSKSPKALPAPENVAVERRVLVWDSVENATGYVVYINGVEYQTNECRLDLHELTVEGGVFDIDVIASGDQKRHLDSLGMRLTVTLDAPPESGTDEKGFAYTYCEDLMGYEISAGTADLTGTVVIPDYFCDYPVKKLAKYALNPYYYPYIKSHLGDLSYNYLNDKAANTETTAVVLPDHLEQIDYYAFIKLLNLTEIVIPDSVTVIGGWAFYNCGNLTRAVLPKTLTAIPVSCFENCPLYEIALPETLVEIGTSAFSRGSGYSKHRDSLPSSVMIPASVQIIGAEAFWNQRNLETIIFEDSSNLKSVGREAFHYTAWYNAQPDSGIIYLETIFYECKNLLLEEETLYIAEPITVVAADAFGDTGAVRQRNVTKIVITAPLKEISSGAFFYCTSLREVILPPGLEMIGWSAFYSTNVTHAYFGGTRAEYEKLLEVSKASSGSYTKPFDEEVVYYYSETEPSEQGNYWHYVDGEATPWFE